MFKATVKHEYSKATVKHEYSEAPGDMQFWFLINLIYYIERNL